jgi:hypothetical protein
MKILCRHEKGTAKRYKEGDGEGWQDWSQHSREPRVSAEEQFLFRYLIDIEPLLAGLPTLSPLRSHGDDERERICILL